MAGSSQQQTAGTAQRPGMVLARSHLRRGNLLTALLGVVAAAAVVLTATGWPGPAIGRAEPVSATTAQSVSIPSSLIGWRSVSEGTTHTCALTSSDALWCWGSGSDGELGTGGAASAASPVAVTAPAGTQWTSVSAGFHFTCGTQSNGSLWCWGRGGYGQRGDGTTTVARQPRRIGNRHRLEPGVRRIPAGLRRARRAEHVRRHAVVLGP